MLIATSGAATACSRSNAGPQAGAQTAYVGNSETTTSRSFVDLKTTSDSVTVTIGSSGLALVSLICAGSNASDSTNYARVSWEVTGASNVPPESNAGYGILLNSTFQQVGVSKLMTGLTPGRTTFKMKYQVESSGTGTFANRSITVVPL